MIRWQRPARIAVALVGLATAIVVYAAIGDRQTAAPVERPRRLDPRAILESAGAALRQFSETRQDFVVNAERQLSYEDGTTKSFGVTIQVRNRGGRDFVVTAREAQATNDKNDLLVDGAVKLVASDGFTITAERASFNRADSTMNVPGAVAFSKGRMSGTGGRMTYNQTAEILTMTGGAHVSVANEAGATLDEFTAESATLARIDKYLALEGSVRAKRGGQLLEANNGLARLTDNQEQITFIELRGNARVTGGESFDAMSARDIDLDYTDDGATLERVKLEGNGAVAMSGDEEGTPGRQFIGDSLDVGLSADASLTSVVGRGNVRVDLPAGRNTPLRTVTAQTIDGAGEAGKGLTSARFSDAVEYREGMRADAPARAARSSELTIQLVDDAITAAVFTGRVRFQEEGLQASAARGEDDPAKGTLLLTGADAGGGPRVVDAEIQVEADSVRVGLDGPVMAAQGNAKTILHANRSSTSGRGARTGTAGESRLPGLLQSGEAVNVNASALDYQGSAGRTVYSGGATLWQGETAIRCDVLTIDRTNGDLICTGAARTSLVFDTGTSVGRASEIRYDDSRRQLTYGSAPPALPPAARGASAPDARGRIVPAPGTAAAASQAQLSGPQGDLQATRIEVALARTESRVERLEANTGVNVRLDTRVATGDRLTYHAADERYVMTGIATVPVKIVEGCRETIGRTVTFFKTGERVIVDGNEEVRTQSTSSGPCPGRPAAR